MTTYEARPLEPDYGRRMTNAEAVLLCRYAKAACPQQQFDAYTPDAWSDLLGDLRFEDCKEAVKNIVQRQPFVAPAEIRDEVRRVRSKRIGDFGPIPDPPPGLDYTPAEHRDWLADTLRRIGDGEVFTRDELEPFGTLERRDVIGELGMAGTSVAEDNAAVIRKARHAAAEARKAVQAARKPEPEPLLGPDDHSREPTPPEPKPLLPTDRDPAAVAARASAATVDERTAR